MTCDVLVVGGGPGGSTVGSLLRKHNSNLNVVILERERFPRDHIGESQLPVTCGVLNEMGVWDKVEAAGFPVKVGSTYRWGATDELWHLNFLQRDFENEPRPASYRGQRTRTAFQVDRSIYDKILLDHARELGCDVTEGAKVVEIRKTGDGVASVDVVFDDKPEVRSTIEAKHYVDASGVSGLFRRTFDVSAETPTKLRNVAVWDYWQNAEWAESVGVGGTFVQILSLDWGWIWFIPIGATRTSIGLVTPSEYLKKSGKTPEELYRLALQAEPRISALLANATPEGKFQTTKDWSYIADRLTGDNWFLIGDAAGFADPILSAGMTLAHVSARKVAYTILEIERQTIDPDWLKAEFNKRHRASVRNHIRFAEYWYSANGRFTDLTEYCSTIANDAGIKLDADQAFAWLSTGGFSTDFIAEERSTAFGFLSAKGLVNRFTDSHAAWEVSKYNEFRVNFQGAKQEPFAVYADGRVHQAFSYRRGDKVLPLIGPNQWVVGLVNREPDAVRLSHLILEYCRNNQNQFPDPKGGFRVALEVLEALITDGWVTGKVRKDRPFLDVQRAD